MSIKLSSILMEHGFFDPRFDINSAYQNSGCKLKSTLHMVQDYCLSFGRKMQFSKRNAASCQGFLHDLQGYCLLKKTIYNFITGTLQKNDTCFFATRGGFIVVFDITFRTGMQYVRFMLHTATETHIPFKGRLYFF